jgi:hypothetical protein
VFLDEDNNVKLGDFGLSKALNQASFANTYVGVRSIWPLFDSDNYPRPHAISLFSIVLSDPCTLPADDDDGRLVR